MLYERWRRVARARPREFALRDAASGEHWTFAQLAEISEQDPRLSGPVAFPQGSGAQFVFDVVRAWRLGQVVCPLEVDQHSPTSLKGLPEGIVHLKTTSATTRTARLIAFSAGQLAADADNIVATMGLRPDWPNLGVISLAHSYGFSNLVLPLLLHGIPLILVGAALPEAVRKAAEAFPAITLAAVPALWRALHGADAIKANIRLAISAGAPLPVVLEEKVYERDGLKIHNFYGSSECGGIAYDDSSTPRSDAACAGAPLKNVYVTVADDGCLEVRGGAVGTAYWPEPSETLQDGVFHTSDLVRIEDNRVWLSGRATDQINVAGRKISPESIENVLLTHPQVEDCLVFGVPSSGADRVEEIAVCVVGRVALSSEGLRQFLLCFLPAWQIPREWRFVDSLATNNLGKASRKEWSKRLRPG